MTRNHFPIAAAAATMAMAAIPAAAAEVQIQASGPVVELAITEAIPATPDIATLDAGVTSFELSAVAAMQANARQMNAVVDRIEALGIDRDDIQTSGISLNPEYEWDESTRAQVFRGYRVANRVSVKLRNIDRTGEVLDALVAAGATDLGGIQWSIDDQTAIQAEARERAMRSAEARAMAYARMAGYTGLRLLEVSENVQSFYPSPVMVATLRSADAAESTPVRPGQVQSGVTVNVKFEMTR